MPLHDIDSILDRIDLESLADELCGPRRGQGSGARWPSPVPAHPQTGRTPPMSIFTDRRGRQRWTCWSTGTSGTAIDLVSVSGSAIGLVTVDYLSERWDDLGSAIGVMLFTPLLVALAIITLFPETAATELETFNPDDPELEPIAEVPTADDRPRPA